MPSDRASQTIRRRRLAAELRRLRERAGLTGDEAAERLGWSGSKISRIETHRIGVKEADLGKLLDLYEVDLSRREELTRFARESSRTGSLESAVAGLPADYADYLSAEDEARSIWNWDPMVVPGLLQTEAYARAAIAGYQSMYRPPPGHAERRIELRRLRQQLLTRDPPVNLSVVIDESVLHRRFGDKTTMHEQMFQLAELSELPNVQVQVLPLSSEHPVTTGAFIYMQFAQVHDVPLHDLVTVEHITATYYLEDEEQTFRYRMAFERLTEESLTQEESRDVILAAARETWAS
jgi:transcriptional regulator with XRE-family HTH domain